MKKTLTQKQINEYEQLCRDRDNGRLLTPDGLRFIAATIDAGANAISCTPPSLGERFSEMMRDYREREQNL